jgi:hypothetical protein
MKSSVRIASNYPQVSQRFSPAHELSDRIELLKQQLLMLRRIRRRLGRQVAQTKSKT